MTEKLYYRDSHMREFEAVVIACEPDKKGYRIVLDRTAFFPEGGGQCADTGSLTAAGGRPGETDGLMSAAPGGLMPAESDGQGAAAAVLDVHEKDGVIYHYTDLPISQGTTVKGVLDWEQRFSNMQQHSGEHIVSGLVHSTFDYDNVGFHLGKELVTMDFNGPLTAEALEDIENRANEVVFSNREIRAEFPDAEVLKTLEYRSKIEIEGEVRIVTVPGVDVCACCAPHVSRTGEIGLIKIVDAQNYKGGTRITILCGGRALSDYRRKQENIREISVALSAKQEQTGAAVKKQKEELASVKEACARAMEELIAYKAAAVPKTGESICLFEEGLDGKAMRELVNLLVPKTAKAAAVFSGSAKEGFRYIVGSSHLDMRGLAKDMNRALNGRGGGSKEMIQGTLFAEKKEIKEFIHGI